MTPLKAQGFTLDKAVFRIGSKASTPGVAFVALTRVRLREDLSISRPFPRDIYNQGPQQGPKTLLAVLKRETVDWADIESTLIPRRKCILCADLLEKTNFHEQQWAQGKHACCKACIHEKQCSGTPWQCCYCREWLSSDGFARKEGNKTDKFCIQCERDNVVAFKERAWCRSCKKCIEEVVHSVFTGGT